ncbi:hypothetical protein R5O67_04425 [Proteus mirabilis]|uniref:hypothetical protein n=1 Tax=Enterobacterales TaxID=91347 RepID=UPI00182BF13D|nr:MULTISPECIES: hypothetical protein [Enterobacterales]EFA4912246.1 hypothetical protein [Escherichia coli]EFO3600122.1 hypothetical protein [Escherichia coli]EFO3683879.1 hypothetical protein [Escherichia coli]EJU2334323.1 hypothetical protein [Escherichia coli]MCK7564816.1 hypothetical protein [Citrobacter koseri]
MKKIWLLISCFSLWLLTGCSVQEIAEWNQKISNLGHQVSNTMNGGMQKREQREYDVVIPVDIDTAAARLRRYYGFEDVNAKIRALRQSGKESDQWVATAIAEESRGWEWEVTPGSYYKMGADMGKRNPPAHIVIELEKNGSGTHMYITYSASYSDTLTPEFVQEIFKTANDVATGKRR